MNKEINPGVNYQFIASNFISAKTSLLKEQRTGEEDTKRILGVGLEGASRTGKSWDAAIFVRQYIDKYEGKVINIARDTLSALKLSVYDTLRKVWSDFGSDCSVFNKSATPIDYQGNRINFIGVNDNIERAKGSECDLLWMNETLSIPPDIAKQYRNRCKEFFIQDYNPSAKKHWLYDMEYREDYRLLKTVIFDNLYAPSNSVKEILSTAHPEVNDYDLIKDKPLFKKKFRSQKEWEAFKMKNLALKTADIFEWSVYGLGKRTASENLVFPDLYRYEEEIEDYDWRLYGGDFGYKTDPTTLIQVTKKGKRLYIKELIYETGLLNNDIADKMHREGLNNELSCWDRAEEKSVDELIYMNINAYAPPKHHIAWGIGKLHQFEIYIHVDSVNCYNEFSEYSYLKKSDGEFKRNSLGHKIAIDANNHTIDAARYALTYYYVDDAREE